MASYPGAVKTFAARNAGDTIQASHVGDLQDEVNAIEAGLLQGTAPLNSSNSTVVHLNVGAGMQVVGNSTLGSTITLGTQTYIWPSTGGNVNDALIVASTSGSTHTLGWSPSAAKMQLLASTSGTDASAGATNVATVAISGLTASDQLLVNVTALESSQAVARIDLYENTAGAVISRLTSGGTMNSGVRLVATTTIMQDQTAATIYNSYVSGATTGGQVSETASISALTAWTGSWTLALRHGGVTAGGGFKWRWAVYKLLGQ